MRLKTIDILSFASVYLIWGSTYLAIRYAIEGIPPWTLSSLRFLVAAGLMLALGLLRRESSITAQERKIAIISGAFLVVANGFVCVTEAWVASGVVAVIIGAMPIWILLMGWAVFGEGRPAAKQVLGALIGVSGIALIAGTGHSAVIAEGGPGILAGVSFLFLSGVLWASGTLLQRRTKGLKSLFRFSALQMVSGGIVTGLFGLAFEKPWALSWADVPAASWWSLGYLIFFGSVISFSAYLHLSRNFTPAVVSTYALVNPLIAVGLGWLFLGENVDLKFAFATALVLVGLALLLFRKKSPVPVTPSRTAEP